MASKYRFSEYRETWPTEFQEEAERLKSLWGDQLIAIHHIGSTSVPGLPAKPTIDLLPVARAISDIDNSFHRLEEAGFRAWGEYGLPGRRLFTRDDTDGFRIANLHFYQADYPDIERHLAFCAFLREFPEIRREYGTLKREVYQRHPDNISDYCDGKNEWIKRVEPLAVDWYRKQSDR